MKPILLITLVLVIIFVSGLLMYDYISKTSKSIDTELAKLDKEVRINKWIPAYKILSTMENKWIDLKDKWALFVDHQEIDNIDLSISKMKEYIKKNDTVDALAEISSLRLLFEHIPKKESLTLTNVL
ncbi:MAG: DUF4363 family protein [Ignavibacteriales bacterium]